MTHGTLHTYANLKCRCEACRDRWNNRARSRSKAITQLIARHGEEFRELWDAEIRKDEA